MSEGANDPRRDVLVVAAVVLALGAGVLGGFIGRRTAGDARAVTSCPAEKVADTVLPSVVTLLVSNGTSGGNGSGEVIRPGGYILTNDHVIAPAGPSGTIDVLFSAGQTVRATVVGRAPRVDLAVVRVTPPDRLPTIEIGESAPLRVGQPVVALGAPLGLSGTVTSGIVSALGRDVPVPSEAGVSAVLPGAIQTDAAINPGNSGGALVDCGGRLVGVNTAIATVPDASGQPGGGSVGIGFAIPVDVAMIVADQLIVRGEYTPPYLGLSEVPISAAAAERFGVSEGLFVQDVTAGGPAQQAGLRAGDILTAVDGRAVRGPDDLFLAVVTARAGEVLTVDYVRAGQTGSAKVTPA